MSQPPSTTNWVIQDSNGHSQMVKLVQPSGKTINGYMTNALSNATSVKIFKPVSSATGQAESSQTYQTISTHTGHPQMIRTIASSPNPTKRAIPVQMNTINSIKPATKTIRLTPSQMQRLMNTTQVMPHQQHHQRQEVVTHHQQQSQNVHQSFSQGVPVIQHSASPIKNHSVTSQVVSSPVSNRKRTELSHPSEGPPETKRSRVRADKIGKGLRHFSMKVCEKVKQKGTTTYNEVADELVSEFTNPTNPDSLADQYDQKNIRRRVYDALNVLMAMNIISKEKKEIRWIGLPSNSVQVKPRECQQLEREVLRRSNTIREKEKHLYELIMNQIAFKSLAQRNKELERMQGPPTLNSSIQLPFIVVNTNKKTVINCSISNDKTEYMFQFSDKFEINDDLEVLKQIGMLHGLDTGTCSRESLEKIKTLIPESLWPYLEKIGSGCKDPLADLFDPASSTSTQTHSLPDDFVEATIDETSRQSGSSGAISPPTVEYSEDGDSDTSSDTEIN